MIRTLPLILALSLLSMPAFAQPKGDPDWPCVQRKVPTLSAGSVWTSEGADTFFVCE